MMLGGFIEQLNAVCACKYDDIANLHFSNYHPLLIFLVHFWEYNSEAVRNIRMILGRIIEQVSAKSRSQE